MINIKTIKHYLWLPKLVLADSIMSSTCLFYRIYGAVFKIRNGNE